MMTKILLTLCLWLGLCQATDAALTQNQYNDHVRTMLEQVVQDDDAPCKVIRICVAYSKLGTNQREAAIRLLSKLYQNRFGVSPTANATTRHDFKHWVESCSEGEGVEP